MLSAAGPMPRTGEAGAPDGSMALTAGESAKIANVASVPKLANIASFVDGNGKSRIDQYPGKAGGGWETAWSGSSKAVAAIVLSGRPKEESPPLDQIEPDYLQVSASGTGTISRSYAGADGTTDRVIQFDYRFDGTSDGDSSDDSIMIFGDDAGDSGLNQTDAAHKTNTWAIKASMNQSKAVWQFGYLNHKGIISFIDNVAIGVAVIKNDVYQFTIDEQLEGGSGAYTATVRDTTAGTVYKTPSSLPFCAKETGTEYLDFGMSLGSGETGKFSIDAIHVATKRTIAPVVFVIGGLGATQNPEPGILSVQQDYEPLFTFAGIDASSFRWYEQDYDTDTSVNPNGDSIAAEIDKVPAGTPVVVMGLSFGGGQAMISASQADRPINDVILFDPVVQTDIYNQVNHTSSNPAEDHPTQISQTVPSNVQYAADFGRVIFQPDGSLYPTGPYAFNIQGKTGTYENLYFPRSTKHQAGQLTPRALTPGAGGSGDPINDTSEIVDNALAGFPLFWDGADNGGS